jgi:hypothetical protein
MCNGAIMEQHCARSEAVKPANGGLQDGHSRVLRAAPPSTAPAHSGDDARDHRIILIMGRYRFAGSRGNMKETLRNPFDAVETPGVPKRTVNRAATRSTPVCSHCQSDDIVAQATVQWSNESQEWELANTFRMPAHCNHCNGGCDITWLSLN